MTIDLTLCHFAFFVIIANLFVALNLPKQSAFLGKTGKPISLYGHKREPVLHGL